MKQKEDFSPTVKMKDLNSELEVQVINGTSCTCMQMLCYHHYITLLIITLILNFKRAHLQVSMRHRPLDMACLKDFSACLMTQMMLDKICTMFYTLDLELTIVTLALNKTKLKKKCNTPPFNF